MPTHDEHTHHILAAIESGRRVSQRTLSRELGIALGLTNLLLRRLIRKGFVKVFATRPNRLLYSITPEGFAEKARLSKAYMDNTLRLYTETRERIRRALDELADQLDREPDEQGAAKRIIFYGAGEVAEIAFVSMQATDLELVGVVDDVVRGRFFGRPVQAPQALTGEGLAGEPFRRVAIMSVRKSDQIAARIRACGIPNARIFRL